jgi:transcriptional regulator with XRE-family HTH domain
MFNISSTQNQRRRSDMEYKIKELREKRKLSQAELAELSGVSRATIIRLENTEEVVINTGTLEKLANALNVSIKSLFLP